MRFPVEHDLWCWCSMLRLLDFLLKVTIPSTCVALSKQPFKINIVGFTLLFFCLSAWDFTAFHFVVKDVWKKTAFKRHGAHLPSKALVSWEDDGRWDMQCLNCLNKPCDIRSDTEVKHHRQIKSVWLSGVLVRGVASRAIWLLSSWKTAWNTQQFMANIWDPRAQGLRFADSFIMLKNGLIQFDAMIQSWKSIACKNSQSCVVPDKTAPNWTEHLLLRNCESHFPASVCGVYPLAMDQYL